MSASIQNSSNRFLSVLSPASRERLLVHCKPVDLALKDTLYRAEETPRYAYLMEAGMTSIVATMENGSMAEVGVIGCEGIVGCLQLLGPAQGPTIAFVQLKGAALRIPYSDLHQAYRDSEEIRDRILEFVQQQAMITSQIAGCNRLHEAEERLARWLLMAQDRVGHSKLDFTQEFLAMMLGARRTTVTLIAGMLQKAGLIEYSRGHVTILDRPGLEAAACHCYQITRQLHDGLYSRPLHGVNGVLHALPFVANGALRPESRTEGI